MTNGINIILEASHVDIETGEATGGYTIAAIKPSHMRETTVPDDFWGQIEHQLARITELESFAAIREVLLDGVTYPLVHQDSGRCGAGGFREDKAFFAGSGGDNQLSSSLSKNWRVIWSDCSYRYTVRNRVTGDCFTYTEGELTLTQAVTHEA